MSDASSVLIPAGPGLLEAAAWVGESCHLELSFHAHLTQALLGGVGPDRSNELWLVRAHRAELAEQWHRRLPELREFPREQFVKATPQALELTGLASTSAPSGFSWVTHTLTALELRYGQHLDVAVGPADLPVADTLQRALTLTNEDLLSLA